MRNATLIFPVRSSQVLLGLKKRGFGKGKWNGFGGKVREESVRDAAIRELEEECGLRADPDELIAMGVLDFLYVDHPQWSMRVHVFIVKQFSSESVESEEMEPQWFAFEAIPYGSMWEDDQHWLPYVLDGKTVNGTFTFERDRIVRIELSIGEQI